MKQRWDTPGIVGNPCCKIDHLELDDIKYAIITGDGKMAWCVNKPATYKTEKGADNKLEQLKRYKHDGYRKVKVYYEEIE